MNKKRKVISPFFGIKEGVVIFFYNLRENILTNAKNKVLL
jgi:hypothetical protein